MRRIKLIVGLAALIASVAVFTACGDDDDDGGSTSTTAASANGALSEVNERIDSALTRPAEIAITEPLDGSIPKGKTLTWLQCSVPSCVQLTEPLRQAAEAVGWDFKVIDIGLTPEEIKAGWQQAVRSKPDVLVAGGGFPPSIYQAELDALEEQGVPIVNYAGAEIEPPKGQLAVVNGGTRFKDYVGPYFADYVAAKTEGKGKVLFVHTSSFPVVNLEVEGYKQQIAKVCPDCETEYFDAPATSIGKDLASKIASQVQANPDVDYIIGAFSDMFLGLPDALKGVGLTAGEDVKLITQYDDQTTLQMIADGEVEMTIDNPGGEQMWQSTDILLRDLLGQDYEKSTDNAGAFTRWIVNKDNLPPESEWKELNAVEDYQAQFKELWGVGGQS